MNSNTMTLTFNGVSLSPISHQNQTWITSVELANALGYKEPDSVTKIYNRNKDEFSENMTMLRGGQIDRLGESSGLQKEQRIFSLRGCHLIAMFAKTAIAKLFRVWVLDILDKEVNQIPYGLKEKVYPEMVAKPHFITRNMERHLKHHVDILVRQSNLTPNKIWRDFCAYFLIDSWQNLPMQNYVAACRYFEIEPIYTPECNNNFVYVDLSRFESVQDENKALRDKVTIFTKQQRDMFRPQEAVESLKKLGYTVLTGMDDEKMTLISVDELEELRNRPTAFIKDYEHLIKYLDEATEQGFRFVKKSDLYDLGLKILDMGI